MARKRIDCSLGRRPRGRGGSGTADNACNSVIDSTTPSGRDDSSTARTASSTTDGEDEQAGTGTPLVIGWLQHLQITTPPVPALNTQVRRLPPDFAAALGVGAQPGAGADQPGERQVTELRAQRLGGDDDQRRDPPLTIG